MTEEPRDRTPPSNDDDDRSVDPEADEISLGELEEDVAGLFEFPTADADEISLEELDAETAGFFEVSAVGGVPGEDERSRDSGPEVYEVEAAPAQPAAPQQNSSAPSPAAPPQGSAGVSQPPDSLRRLHNVEVEVIATLGTTRMQIKDILGLHVGSVVELHRLVGEPIDITLNGRLIARGEVVVVDEKFAIRVNEIAGNGE